MSCNSPGLTGVIVCALCPGPVEGSVPVGQVSHPSQGRDAHPWHQMVRCNLAWWSCAGARCTATLLHEMAKRGKAARYGVVSMCIGSGMGAAAVFERGPEADSVAFAQPVYAQGALSRDADV